MIHYSLSDVAKILNSPEPSEPGQIQGLSIDTRTLSPGNLFFALQGENDGHLFVEAALKRGAAAAVVSRPVPIALPQLIVNDPLHALGKLAATWRNRFSIPLVAVTGSNGKTTLKNMIASILRAHCAGQAEHVLATQGNLNNLIGVPLTLAQLNPHHRYAVIEMGMNHPGEISELTHYAKPTTAVISNAAPAHLEYLKTVAGVAKAKAEIFEGLSEDGTAILNRDDAFFEYWKNRVTQTILTFGFHPEADCCLRTAKANLIEVQTPNGVFSANLPLLGQHNQLNALAATAAALSAGIELSAIQKGLEQLKPTPGRLCQYILASGMRIIDDTYNANPASLRAAIHTLAEFPGHKILVMGDMKELGHDAAEQHAALGKEALTSGIHALFTLGEMSREATHAFGEGAQHFSDQDALIEALRPKLTRDTTLLVKGSRSMQMDHIVEKLVPHENWMPVH